VDHASQKGSRRQDHGSSQVPSAVLGLHPAHSAGLHHETGYGSLHQLQILPPIEKRAHRPPVESAIALRPR
jgi:hypothetical protein